MGNWVLAVLLSVPCMVVVPPEVVAEVITGKFCRLLAPVSVSAGQAAGFGSFAVTPSGLRSIPSPVLEWIELKRILLPVPL